MVELYTVPKNEASSMTSKIDIAISIYRKAYQVEKEKPSILQSTFSPVTKVPMLNKAV
jgi:hypothetical protein